MRNVIWSILLLTFLCGVASAATLSVEPVEITCFSGDRVNLTVVVRDVNNLGGFDFDVTWDPAVIKYEDVTAGSDVNEYMVNANTASNGRIRVAGVSTYGITTVDGVGLFTVRFVGRGESGSSTPVKLVVNNYGFLNSTSGEEIPVSKVTNATVKMKDYNLVDAQIATASNRVIVGVESMVIASVVNRQGVTTENLRVEVVIENETTKIIDETYDEEIPPWSAFQEGIRWRPEAPGTYTATINVTNLTDVELRGKTNSTKKIIVEDYTIGFDSDIYGPWDGRASTGSWFYMESFVNASHSGNVWLNITAPEHVEVYGGRNQTRYLSATNWNYVSVYMRSEKPGKIAAGDIKFEIAANGKTVSKDAPELMIWIPSIRVSSVNATSVDSSQSGELTFNTLHTNNTYDNVTKIVVQSGAPGRTLSGLGYLVSYPYGCVEQTTSQMLASLNVKNYYLTRDKPSNWDWIRSSANSSVEAGVNKLVSGGEIGQHNDGGWSLWGGNYYTSESSSSSYAGYTLARVNMPDEDLNRLLQGKISNDTTVEPGKVNFEKLIEWFHDHPDDSSSGTWTWSAHVCHSWTPQSNTAFVMLIHDMINQTVDVEQPYRGYMEDNMRNATRYFVTTSATDGSWGIGYEKAMATALALWGLEEFAMPSDNVSEGDIEAVKEAAKEWLIENQNDDGSWSAGSYYGWYDNGRKTESTGYAVLALNATGIPADNETIQKGVNWLIKQYESGGGWGYTWATQVAIDALIQCQPAVTAGGTVEVEIDEESIGSFAVDDTNPRVEYTLSPDQMNTLMAAGDHVRTIDASGGNGEVRSHVLTATLTTGNGPILVSVDHSQSGPIKEIDGSIRDSRLIQSFDDEEDGGVLQISSDIGILEEAWLMQDEQNSYTVEIFSSDQMVAGEEAEVTIRVVSQKNVYSPMIEIPIAGFMFDSSSEITENGYTGAFEVLNGTAGDVNTSLFIQSVGWERGDPMTYVFSITPSDHGKLYLDLRIRPLYDETDVYLVDGTFDVLGRGNVTVNVVDEEGNAKNAGSIALVGVGNVSGKSTHTFDKILEGNYTLVVNGTDNYPSIRTAVRVTPDAAVLCNVTLPSSLTSPTLVFSEGGAGSIASVEWVPPGRLSAAYPENTTYNITVLGDGGELGIALEFPMRYLMNDPVVKVNGEVTEDYEIINGTFEYDEDGATYSTTNATLIVYNTTSGSNTVEIGFEGGLLGDATSNGKVNVFDAVAVLNFVVGNIGVNEFQNAYDYPDATKNGKTNVFDAVAILNYIVGNVDEYYDPILYS